jgi:hypothetical protein
VFIAGTFRSFFQLIALQKQAYDMSLGAAVSSIEAAVDGGGTGAALATGQADAEGEGGAWQASPNDLMAVWNYSRCVGETQAIFTVKSVIFVCRPFCKDRLGTNIRKTHSTTNGDVLSATDVLRSRWIA